MSTSQPYSQDFKFIFNVDNMIIVYIIMSSIHKKTIYIHTICGMKLSNDIKTDIGHLNH